MKKLIPFTFAIALLSSAMISSCPACGSTNIGGFGKTVVDSSGKEYVIPPKTDKGKLQPPKKRDIERELKKGKKQMPEMPTEPEKVMEKQQPAPLAPAPKTQEKVGGWWNGWFKK